MGGWRRSVRRERRLATLERKSLRTGWWTRQERRRLTCLRAKEALRGKPLERKQRRRAFHREWAMLMEQMHARIRLGK